VINELPRRGLIPRILTRLGLILVGFVAAGLLVAGVAGIAWLSR
jgi:hypothetical protein